MTIPIEMEQSSFGVSVGTGLALETLFEPLTSSLDPDREVTRVDLSKYNHYLFNVGTILRNMLSSMKPEVVASARLDVIYDNFVDELTAIHGLFAGAGANIDFYVNTYSYFTNNYADSMRKSNTAKALRTDEIFKYCLKKIVSEDLPIRTFHKDINYGKDKLTLVFTHIPADLLGYKNFGKLDLLESHTGKIKGRAEWNSKYFPVPDCDMSILPLMEYFLVKFGDKVMFSPAPLKERKELYATLKKSKITPLTDYGFNVLLK